ncbi:hypothetical protein GUJ93_ZPchr0002g25147 [Zizania palustris]|uniref:Uncharacterized protein n=1 Tax=Zizania palustris TaxID=103762 RepID=A0A8J5S8P2_ZIZPA|nr:hypothetical protein GUJ93_ZPchr0002g25147 [Zizania palustris]
MLLKKVDLPFPSASRVRPPPAPISNRRAAAPESCCFRRVLARRFWAMGLFRGSFTFMVGMGCGVYVAQNYAVPNIKKLFNTYVFMAKHVEETYRKPKKDDD